jgi:ribosome biogenesis GTPase A
MLRRIQQLVSLRDFRPYAQQLTNPLVACLHTIGGLQAADSMRSPEPNEQELDLLDGSVADLLGHLPDEGGVPEEEQLLLQAAVVGVPNAGKSTLTNALVGKKVSLMTTFHLQQSLVNCWLACCKAQPCVLHCELKSRPLLEKCQDPSYGCAQVSAVSPKTNTTAYSRLGAFTEGRTQVVLYDTPGVVDSK